MTFQLVQMAKPLNSDLAQRVYVGLNSPHQGPIIQMVGDHSADFIYTGQVFIGQFNIRSPGILFKFQRAVAQTQISLSGSLKRFRTSEKGL